MFLFNPLFLRGICNQNTHHFAGWRIQPRLKHVVQAAMLAAPAALASLRQGRCNTISSTNLLPKNASSNSTIATRVQRTALLPRQP